MHNNQHIKEIKKWISAIKNSISRDVGEELTNAIQYFYKMNQTFESAMEIAKKLDYEEEKGKTKKPQRKMITKKLKPNNILSLKQIGVIRTPYKDNAPYQPVENDEADFQIIVDPEYTEGLDKLDTFRYIYVIYYIHRISRKTEYIVSPPWTGGTEVGIFASRSPVRPNLIGLSIVQIKKIINNKIFTTGLDVFDETPLLDIKPYVKDLDSKCDANYGWIEDLNDYEHLLLHIKGIPHDY